MQAIRTKAIAPTNTRGPRVAASCDAGRVVISWDHKLYIDDNHEAAANALARKLGWLDNGWVLVGGGLGAEFVWVLVHPSRFAKEA